MVPSGEREMCVLWRAGNSERDLVDAFTSVLGPDAELVAHVGEGERWGIIPKVVFDHTCGV
jgi:hypothetical protein